MFNSRQLVKVAGIVAILFLLSTWLARPVQAQSITDRLGELEKNTAALNGVPAKVDALAEKVDRLYAEVQKLTAPKPATPMQPADPLTIAQQQPKLKLDCGCGAGAKCTCTTCLCEPLTFRQGYDLAMSNGKDMVLFVNQPVQRIEGCVVCSALSYDRSTEPRVIIGRRGEGQMDLVANLVGTSPAWAVNKARSATVGQTYYYYQAQPFSGFGGSCAGGG